MLLVSLRRASKINLKNLYHENTFHIITNLKIMGKNIIINRINIILNYINIISIITFTIIF